MIKNICICNVVIVCVRIYFFLSELNGNDNRNNFLMYDVEEGQSVLEEMNVREWRT